MKTNTKAPSHDSTLVLHDTRLAGGMGMAAAKQDAEELLRRAVLACLLFEDTAYQDGVSITDQIKALIPQVAPERVAALAIEARTAQKLRHVPLFIAREMARLETHKHYVGTLLPQIILRADELAEFLALYWKEGKQPLSKQVKIGLRASFARFNEYQFAKYKGAGNAVKLRDVMKLVRPKPEQGREDLYMRILKNELTTPDTWEVALSSGADKKATWERLIVDDKLGALAFVRNLRNMTTAGVDESVIRQGFAQLKTDWLLPLNYLAAVKNAPQWMRELEDAMLRGLSQAPKLAGTSIIVVDVSGSMMSAISGKSDFTRLGAGAAMAILAAEMCERVIIYVTAGSDGQGVHQTVRVNPYRGFALEAEIGRLYGELGRGGIFTRQALEFISQQGHGAVDRILVFSDSQDCDRSDNRLPKPFGRYNYIVDVSSHTHGVNYKGVWTAELSGWSEKFFEYILALESDN